VAVTVGAATHLAVVADLFADADRFGVLGGEDGVDAGLDLGFGQPYPCRGFLGEAVIDTFEHPGVLDQFGARHDRGEHPVVQ
jgi:hypothetical protein